MEEIDNEIAEFEKNWQKLYRDVVEGINIKENTATSDDVIYNLNNNLRQQLQDWMHGGGQKNGSYNGSYFELGTTPSVLTKHGAPSTDI